MTDRSYSTSFVGQLDVLLDPMCVEPPGSSRYERRVFASVILHLVSFWLFHRLFCRYYRQHSRCIYSCTVSMLLAHMPYRKAASAASAAATPRPSGGEHCDPLDCCKSADTEERVGWGELLCECVWCVWCVEGRGKGWPGGQRPKGKRWEGRGAKGRGKEETWWQGEERGEEEMDESRSHIGSEMTMSHGRWKYPAFTVYTQRWWMSWRHWHMFDTEVLAEKLAEPLWINPTLLL